MELLSEINSKIITYSVIGSFLGGAIGWVFTQCFSLFLEKYKFGFKKRELLFSIRLEALCELNKVRNYLLCSQMIHSSNDGDEWWDYLSSVAVRKQSSLAALIDYRERYQHVLSSEINGYIAKVVERLSGMASVGIDGVDSTTQERDIEGRLSDIKKSMNKAYVSLSKELTP